MTLEARALQISAKSGSLIAQLVQQVKSQIKQLKLVQKGGDVKNHNLAQILDQNSDLQHKDGEDDGSSGEVSTIVIEIALNGYLVTFSYDDGTEEKYVHDDFDDVMSQVRSKH